MAGAEEKKEEYHPPELDPEALEEIGRMIEWSKLEEQAIEITNASKYGPKKYMGHVVRIDPVERWLVMRNGEDKELIPFSVIIGAEEPSDDA